MLRKSKTFDWREKKAAQARIRISVKRLLKKYKYPPEEEEGAMESVIKQVELWEDNAELFNEIAAPVQNISKRPFVYKMTDDQPMNMAAEKEE